MFTRLARALSRVELAGFVGSFVVDGAFSASYRPPEVPNQADPSELSRTAQVVKAIYLSAASIVGVLVAASVIVELWFPARAVASGLESVGDRPSDAEILRCVRDVQGLLDELSVAAAEAVGPPAPTKVRKPVAARWTQFSRDWRHRWTAVGTQCRFSELDGAGIHFDRAARVYGDLASELLRYDGLVRRFDNEQASELASMRRALSKSERALERRLR